MAMFATFFAVMAPNVEVTTTAPSPTLDQPSPRALALHQKGKEQALLTTYLATKYKQSLEVTHRIVEAAYHEGGRFGISPLLVLAIVEQESSLRPEVGNFYGAIGLMQVVPRFHPEKLAGIKTNDDLKKPEVNIRVGSWILAEYLIQKKGDLRKAMVKYSGNATDYGPKVFRFQSKLELVTARVSRQDCSVLDGHIFI